MCFFEDRGEKNLVLFYNMAETSKNKANVETAARPRTRWSKVPPHAGGSQTLITLGFTEGKHLMADKLQSKLH